MINSQPATWNSLSMADGLYDMRLAYTTDFPITASSVIHYTNIVTFTVSNRSFTGCAGFETTSPDAFRHWSTSYSHPQPARDPIR